jgi:hypothetical protein
MSVRIFGTHDEATIVHFARHARAILAGEQTDPLEWA